MAEGLQSACKVLEEFQTIFQPCFGPYGKDVLMKSDTGVMYLSKEGNFVLQHLHLKHPVARLIKETVANYHNQTGDFSKTFILLLAQFFRKLSAEYLQKGSARTMDNIVHTLSGVSLSIFKIRDHLEKGFHGNSEIIQYIAPESFLDGFLDKVLDMSFFGHLDTPLKRIFMKLCYGVLRHIQFHYGMLGYIVQHFDSICMAVCGVPLEHSTVLDGCVIQRDTKPFEFNRQNVKFLLVAGNSGGNNDNNYVYRISTEPFGDVETTLHSKLLDILQRERITCIFTEDALPNKLESLFSHLFIVMVTHVLLEDLERLSHRYQISILSGLHDVLNISDVEKTIGHASFIKSVVVGTSRACHLGPIPIQTTTTEPHNTMNIEILLCCPSQGLLTQYQRILHNTFKVLKQAFVETSNEFVLIPAGGVFEICISNALRVYHQNTTDEVDRRIALMLSKCFLEVPRLLHEASLKKTNKRFLLGVGDELSKLHCVDALSGDLLDACDMKYFEPFNSKMKLLFVFLEFSAQLVKLQHVVPVRKMNVDDGDDGSGNESD